MSPGGGHLEGQGVLWVLEVSADEGEVGLTWAGWPSRPTFLWPPWLLDSGKCLFHIKNVMLG